MKFADPSDIADLFDEAQIYLPGATGAHLFGDGFSIRQADDISKLEAWKAGHSPEVLRFYNRQAARKRRKRPEIKAARAAWIKQYRAKNPEKHIESSRKYNERNREKINARMRERYAAKREEILAKVRAARKANPESNRESCRKYREKKRAAKAGQ